MANDNTCGLPYKVVGPYNQTLFLGCSVTSFNISLGWGAEASTLTVNLLEDRAFHPSSNRYGPMETYLNDVINSQTPSQAAESKAFNVDPDTGNMLEDKTKTMHRTISREMIEQEKSRFSNNKRLYDNPRTVGDEHIVDDGKVCWGPDGTKKFWTNPDPGFLGLSNKFNSLGYDIIGTPVLFKFDDIFFGGMIHSWKNVGSQGGWPTYEVEVRSFASLLNGCQLIIDGYAGTVSSVVPNTADNPTGQDVSVPHAYVKTSAGMSYLPYNGSIAQGNLPNVFNIYGHLESYGFGNSGRTDRGIPALYIYNTLISMLGPGTDESHGPFNPYGAILGRTITRLDGSAVDPFYERLNPNSFGSNVNGGDLYLYDIGICRNRIPVPASNGEAPDASFRRTMFKLDISQVPVPPVGLYMQGPTLSLMQFITEICDGAGVDFFIDFLPTDKNDDYAGTIVVRTVSRRTQPNRQVIKNLVNSLVQAEVNVSTYHYGQEFNDQNTRVMYVGGKQKRLLQVKSTPLASNQTTLVFDPFANNGDGSFVDNDTLGQPGYNQVREPNAMSTRRYKYRMAPGGGAVVAESQTKENFPGGGYSEGSFDDATYFTSALSSLPIKRGNYHDAKNIQTIIDLVWTPLKNHPYYTNMISPYFGVGSLGLARKVYYDPGMSQMQIIFDVPDILNLISADTPGAYDGISGTSPQFMVLENELRAAGKGFHEWITYCFSNFFTTDVQQIVYKVFIQTYGSQTSKDDWLNVIGEVINMTSNRWNNIRNGRPNRQNLNSASPYARIWFKNLETIHQFFNQIAQEYYGKQFMVRVPSPRWYRDTSLLDVQDVNVNATINTGVSNTIYIRKGGGKVYTDWEPSPDGAWEEPGNIIDDTILVGSKYGSMMADEQGKIPPIIGYNASAEYDFKNMFMGRQQAAARAIAKRTISGPDYREIISFELNHSDKEYFYRSIHHALPADEYINIPYVSAAALNMKTAHGKSLGNNKIAKMYVKGSLDQDIVFLDSVNGEYAEPRAVVKISSPVYMGAGRNSTDYSLNAVMCQDSIVKYMKGNSVPTTNLGVRNNTTVWNGMDWTGVPTYDPLDATGPMAQAMFLYRGTISRIRTLIMEEGYAYADIGGPDDESSRNRGIMPKAAIPCFAAVPLQSNILVYGPWINHPGSLAQNIFPDSITEDPLREAQQKANNLIGGVKVNIDEGLTPWEYGGMDALDSAVLDRIFEDVNYQQVNENGSIQVPGYVLVNTQNGVAFNVGDALQYEASFNGPIVSNIQVQVGEGGITATYNMRTYVRKLGFFNKENADRIKLIGQESIKRRKELATQITKVENSLFAGAPRLRGPDLSAGTVFESILRQSDRDKMRRSSPANVLVGQAYNHISYNSSISDLQLQIGYAPFWNKEPVCLDSSIQYTPEQFPKQLTHTVLYEAGESPKELIQGYNTKSFMSLDGLLSPISFYPTEHGSTYAATKYPRPGCPFCKGTGRYSYKIVPDIVTNNMTDLDSLKRFVSITHNAIETKTEDCRYCEPIVDKAKRAFISVAPKETMPPYILTNKDDLSTISVLPDIGNTGNPIINQLTLNPVIMSVGEFSCFQNRQQNDLTAHSIEIIGDGQSPPENDNFIQLPLSNHVNKRYVDYDAKFIDFANNHPDLGLDSSFPIANNQRFFGLRGPLMVHGWGYDLEGYPVPNASGEPKIIDGQILKDSNGKTVYKNQTQKDDGSWTKPHKENKFYKGWGQLPGTWPVGPVDLRWDENARVWTVGSNYKPVWVQIETDLVSEEPSRGVIIGDASSNDPLPDNLRKLVFVKDTLGINASPRGAQIYCKYNSEDGFYEPIYNKPHITSGIIGGGRTATIYRLNSDSDETYSSVYDNPLNFNASVGDIGIFVYLNGKWILQSAKD